MAEDKKIETMLAADKQNEAAEVMDFLGTLDPYEKREFLGFMRGAKMVKALQQSGEQKVAVATA